MSANEHTPSDPESEPETVDADYSPSSGSTRVSGVSRRMFRRRRSRELITDASYTHEQNIQSRERQYALLQGLRLPFIVAAMAAAWAHWWVLAGVLFVVSVPLPWIAVVRGNAQGEVRDTRQKNVYKPAAARQQQRMLAQQQRAALDSPRAEGSNSPAIIDHND
ncbi:DUF3099 domain-containing protein [Corynebacterium fournieri]|uniref:DUF3099 domain-containing protein n=1 Tax=Corynebacterium fournieri TaxID=1852390 RepID=UPI000A2F802C|nr:DUF3099 domain-containing protein [Corynebacterium fournieri]WJY97726.1 hypothetical protein CFOUR_06585 [Corynebacterium fournieri]